MISLAFRIKEHAHALGLELAGIAPATPADGFDKLRSWLDQGFAGEMEYMQRNADARRHPSSILPEVRSVVMVGMNYKPDNRARRSGASGQGGKVARYAQGEDYHDILRQRLNQLLAKVQEEVPGCR